jgi:hypothetical protein
MKINVFVIHTNQNIEVNVDPDWSVIDFLESSKLFDFIPEIDGFTYYNNVMVDRLISFRILNITEGDVIVIDYKKVKRRKIRPMILE